MKLIILRTFIFLILLAGMQACEKDVTRKVDLKVLNQLAITAFISPQDTGIVVKLQRTQPAVGRQYTGDELKIKNAVVKLSDGNQSIPLNYIEKQDSYHAKKTLLPIVAGKTYTLNVTTPNGWEASAVTTVPVITNISITGYKLNAKSDKFSGLKNILNFKWQDAPGQDNYYQTLAYRENKINSQIFQQTFNPRHEKDMYITDKDHDGEELICIDKVHETSKPDNFQRPYKLHLLLLVTDKNYYLYHNSVIKQREADDNPFAEPVLIYTNIKGGVGVFAAYNLIEEIKVVN